VGSFTLEAVKNKTIAGFYANNPLAEISTRPFKFIKFCSRAANKNYQFVFFVFVWSRWQL
jgi:hypothetical protein